MKPPEEFFEDYQNMRTHLEWAQAGLGKGDDVAQGKLAVAGFREFYEKWQPKIRDPELRDGVEAVRESVARLQRQLERIFLAHLHEVIEARSDWWVSEQLFKSSLAFIKLMAVVPPQMRSDLEKIHRDSMGEEYEPTAEYQDAEASANESEAKFRKALAAFEIDWPERVDAAMRARFEQLDGNGANLWQAEVAAQAEKLRCNTA